MDRKGLERLDRVVDHGQRLERDPQVQAGLDAVRAEHRLAIQRLAGVAVVPGPGHELGLAALLDLAQAGDVVVVELEAVLRVLGQHVLVRLDQRLQRGVLLIGDLDQVVPRLHDVVGEERLGRRRRGHGDRLLGAEVERETGDDHHGDQAEDHPNGRLAAVVVGGDEDGRVGHQTLWRRTRKTGSGVEGAGQKYQILTLLSTAVGATPRGCPMNR